MGCRRGGQIAGFADPICRPGYLLLENVAVLPAAQGRGTGARLLALAEEHARDLGLGEIRLYTRTENIAYYARHGYAETHRAEQDGFHRVFLRKPIDTGSATENLLRVVFIRGMAPLSRR